MGILVGLKQFSEKIGTMISQIDVEDENEKGNLNSFIGSDVSAQDIAMLNKAMKDAEQYQKKLESNATSKMRQPLVNKVATETNMPKMQVNNVKSKEQTTAEIERED